MYLPKYNTNSTVNYLFQFGRTPLHYAAYTGNLDSVRILLKYGAMIDTTDMVNIYS